MVGRREATKADEPDKNPDSSAAPEGSRGRTSDPLETHRVGGRSILASTAAAIATATTSACTAVNATTGEAAGTGYPRLGFAHHEPPPLVFVVIESLDRCLSLGVRVHLDEAEPLAAARVTVLDDLGVCTVPNGVNHSCSSDEDTE